MESLWLTVFILTSVIYLIYEIDCWVIISGSLLWIVTPLSFVQPGSVSGLSVSRQADWRSFFFVRLCGSRQGFHLSFRYCFLITVSLLGVFLTPHSFFHAYTTPNAYFLPLPVPLLLSWLFSCLTSRFFLWCSD